MGCGFHCSLSPSLYLCLCLSRHNFPNDNFIILTTTPSSFSHLIIVQQHSSLSKLIIERTRSMQNSPLEGKRKKKKKRRNCRTTFRINSIELLNQDCIQIR